MHGDSNIKFICYILYQATRLSHRAISSTSFNPYFKTSHLGTLYRMLLGHLIV
jgi:hypothetical protein